MLDEPLTGLDLVSARTIDRLLHEEPARAAAMARGDFPASLAAAIAPLHW